VTDIDPRLRTALAAQLGQWRSALEGGAERVGWKLGIGDRESIGPGPVIGHLTSATQLDPASTFPATGAMALHADAEVAVQVGRAVDPGSDLAGAREAIAGFGSALELVDLGGPPDDPQGVVAANVFHRAFALGPLDAQPPADRVEGRLIVNGETRVAATAARDFPETVRAVAALLGAMGERLEAGDVLITGSVVQLPVDPGDEVIANMGQLGRVGLTVAE